MESNVFLRVKDFRDEIFRTFFPNSGYENIQEPKELPATMCDIINLEGHIINHLLSYKTFQLNFIRVFVVLKFQI